MNVDDAIAIYASMNEIGPESLIKVSCGAIFIEDAVNTELHLDVLHRGASDPLMRVDELVVLEA